MREDGDDDQQAEYESEEELVDNLKQWCYPLMKLTLLILMPRNLTGIPYGIFHTLYMRLKDSIA